MQIRNDIENFLRYVQTLYFVPPSVNNKSRGLPIIFFILHKAAWNEIYEWNVFKNIDEYFVDSRIHIHFSSQPSLTITLTNKESGDSINVRNFQFDGPLLEFFEIINEGEKILLLLCFKRNNKIEFHPLSYESKGISAHSFSIEKKNYSE